MKGSLAFVIGPIIMVIVIIIAAVIAWWFSSAYPIVCRFAGPILDAMGFGGLCFWIQFLLVMFVIAYIANKFR